MEDYAWKSRMARAFTQRIYLLPDQSRVEDGGRYCFKVMGNTDNAYDVIMDDASVYCSCPDHSSRGNFCKHLMFIMLRVIGMPVGDVQRYAVMDVEFDTSASTLEHCARFFANMQEARVLLDSSGKSEDGKKRKPIEDDDDCPICYELFKDTADEATVWCKAACGKSIHTACFAKWKRASRNVTCVYCRAPWK